MKSIKPTITVNVILLLILIFINCTRKAEDLDFWDTGKIIDNANSVITKDTIWHDLFGGDTIDYYVSGLVRITNSATLTIDPGVRISFEDTSSGIRVEGTSALKAVGEANKRIVFSCRKKYDGSWLGIIFASNNSANILQYANIEKAGSKIDKGYSDKTAQISLAKNVQAHAIINDCILSGDADYGLWVAPSGDVDLTFKRNQVAAGSISSVFICPYNMADIDSTNVLLWGQFIQVTSNNDQINNTDTIKNTYKPFRIFGKIFVTGSLVISPGSRFQFDKDGEIITSDAGGTNHTGIITAIGTAAKPIVFSGVPYSQTFWTGITITSSNNNIFKYCTVIGAGNSGAFGNSTSTKGNFVVGRTGQPAKATIQYCTIADGKGFGITKYSTSTVTTTVMVIVNRVITFVETNQYSNNISGNLGTY